MRKRMEAKEMWFLRRMLRVLWAARRADKEVLKRSGRKRELLTVIMKRQLGFLGHVCYNMIIHSSTFWNVNKVLRKHSPELSLSQLVNMFTSSIFYYS